MHLAFRCRQTEPRRPRLASARITHADETAPLATFCRSRLRRPRGVVHRDPSRLDAPPVHSDLGCRRGRPRVRAVVEPLPRRLVPDTRRRASRHAPDREEGRALPRRSGARRVAEDRRGSGLPEEVPASRRGPLRARPVRPAVESDHDGAPSPVGPLTMRESGFAFTPLLYLYLRTLVRPAEGARARDILHSRSRTWRIATGCPPR